MKKIILIVVVVALVLGAVVYATIHHDSGLASVTADKVQRHDITSIVSASGEIKPKTYVNLGANAMGKITHLYVKEGDRVKKGQVVAQLENVQPAADVAATRASLDASRMDTAAADANYKAAQADLERAKADFDQKKLDWERSQELYKQQLIPKSEYDTSKANFGVSQAGLLQAQTRVTQAKAQMDSAQGKIAQNQANLQRVRDVLSKTEYIAPYDGVVTNVPVREGETVVMGIQNSPGSTLMTIADLSVITAEVMVDETDVINIKLGQPADVTIDAIPNKVFKGKVTEIGDNAILRSSGVSTSQSTTGSQEAKDFKVVITLDDPPNNLRPGLSTTAKIMTAQKSDAIAVPIQALVERKPSELQASTRSGALPPPANNAASSKETPVQGVFVLTGQGDKRTAEFRKIDTGIYGNTDVEVTNGLKEGDQIITGSYRVLRTLKNGTRVKIEKPDKKADQSS